MTTMKYYVSILILWICSLNLTSSNTTSDPSITSSVKTTNNPEFAGTNVTFFDCNTYTSCTSCVSSMSACNWCVNGHKCTHDTAENCRNDVLVTGVNLGGPSDRSGPTTCPRIDSLIDGSSEILVPAGTKKAIQVKVHIVDQFIKKIRFLCKFNIEGRLGVVNADLLGDTIYCDAKAFAYTQSVPKITATFAVIWGGSKPLDNPSDVRVVVYKCSEMAKSSNECSVLEGKYNCVWCQSTNSCELNNQCKNT